MKKICMLSIAVLVAVVAAIMLRQEKGLVFAQSTQFTLEGRTAALQSETTMANSETLLNALSAAKPVKEASGREVALLTAATGEQIIPIQIVKGENALYLIKGKECFATDATAFTDALLQAFPDMYRFTALPRVQAVVEEQPYQCKMGSAEYSYYLLDGRAVQTEATIVEEREEGLLKLEEPQLPALQYEVQPQAEQYTIYNSENGTLLYTGSAAGLPTLRIAPNTPYRVQLRAEYQTENFFGGIEYYFNYIYERPTIEFKLSGGEYPGEALVIEGIGLQGETIKVTSPFPATPTFFESKNGKKVGLLPINYYTAPGSYQITIQAGEYSQTFTHIVKSKEFQVQHLTVDAATTEETLNSQRANAEFEATMVPLRQLADDVQYWEGRFILPVAETAKVTTGFGAIRYTNGSATASRHGALDLALPEGSPVYATNHGRVLYAGYQQLTGYTIVIEHGYGLKTWHYHMSAINVETGQMVKQGEQIGAVGSTGFSSGPHLHFGMSVHGVYINPRTAIDTDLFNRVF